MENEPALVGRRRLLLALVCLFPRDQTMPEASGLELARRALAMKAGVPLLPTIGHATAEALGHERAAGVEDELTRPFSAQALLDWALAAR